MDWEAIVAQAEQLAQRLNQQGVDLSEAEKLVDYALFLWKKDSRSAAVNFQKYLARMGSQPPPRSRRTQHYYQAMARLWPTLPADLPFMDRVRLWGWAVKIARANRLLQTAGYGNR